MKDGDVGIVDRCKPLFEALGPKLLVIGDKPSQANVVKLTGNFMIASGNSAARLWRMQESLQCPWRQRLKGLLKPLSRGSVQLLNAAECPVCCCAPQLQNSGLNRLQRVI